MCSKLCRATNVSLLSRMGPGFLKLQNVPAPRAPFSRQLFGFPKQYRQPMSNKFQLSHVWRHHWELTPLLLCLVVDMLLITGAICSGFKDRVDIQLTGHSWNCISRNMDLREPTIHKHLVFNQEYRPWPRMQAVLDKMAEKEAKPCPLRKS